MVNGRTTISVQHNYILIPKQTGEFTIGAASVELGGQVYKSRPFRVRILEASATPQESDALFITARVSNDRPYVGEQVLFTWRFYRRVPVANASLTSLEFGDLVAEVRLPRPGQPQADTYEGEGFVVLRHPSTARVSEGLQRLVRLVRVEMG